MDDNSQPIQNNPTNTDDTSARVAEPTANQPTVDTAPAAQPAQTPVTDWGGGGTLATVRQIEQKEPLITKIDGKYKLSRRLVIGLRIALAVVILAVIGLVAAIVTYGQPKNALYHSMLRAVQAKYVRIDDTYEVTAQGVPSLIIKTELHGNDRLQLSSNSKIELNNNDKKNTVDVDFVYPEATKLLFRPTRLKAFVDEATKGETVLTDTLKEFDQVIGGIDKKWVEVTLDDINSVFEKNAKAKEVSCLVSTLSGYKESYAEHDEAKQLLDTADPIKIVESSFVWTDRGPAQKLRLSIDSAALQRLIKQFKSTRIFDRLDNCTEADLSKTIDDVAKKFLDDKSDQKPTIDYWVQAITHDPIKIRYELSDKTQKITHEVSFASEPDNHVSIPQKDKSLKEFRLDAEKFFGVTLQELQAKARDADRQNDVAEVARSLEAYYADNGRYLSPSDITAQNMPTKLKVAMNILTTPGSKDFSYHSARDAVVQSPTFSQYVYQPLTADGKICAGSSSCQKFILWYRLESDHSVRKVTSFN